MLEFRHLPIAIHGFIGKARRHSFECLGQASDDRVLCGLGFESGKDRIKAEAGIGADAQLTYLRWNIGEARVQHFDTAIPCSSITGTEFGIPEKGGISFYTEERIVGLLAAIEGIVTDGSPFLIPEYRDNGAVQIENQPGAPTWQADECLQQLIVDPVQLLPEDVRCVV